VEERVGGRRERRRVGARIGLGRHGFVGCLVAGAGGGGRMARLWSLRRRRRGSCRGCMMGGEVEGRLASLGGECRLRCGDEEDRAIAYGIEGVEVEVELARERQ
jgi:hypothetical protein